MIYRQLQYVLPLFLTLFLMLLIACPVTYEAAPVEDPADTAVIEENSTLFVEEAETGLVNFTTNESRFLGTYGFTLWMETGQVEDPFTALSVQLTKYSGVEEAGYGIVFCSGENSRLVLLINTRGEYIIGELAGNSFTVLQEWTSTADLKKGYSQTNKADIAYDQDTGNFTLTFNDGDAIIFRDDEEPYHTSGAPGYIAVISPLENFPDVPVSIDYEFLE